MKTSSCSRRCCLAPSARARAGASAEGDRRPARPRRRALHPQAAAGPRGAGAVAGAQGAAHLDREEARRQAPRGDRPAPRRSSQSNPTARTRAPRACSSSPSCCGRSRAGSISSRWTTTSRELEKCAQKKGDCEQPKEPRIELKEAEALYSELHDKFPTFRRMDLVTYLIGFAAKEDNREDEAMEQFQEVIERFPQSPLFGDAWMMIGEHYFADAQWAKAKDAYSHIPRGRGDQRPRDVQDRVVRVEARQHRPGREGLQARARQGRRGRAHRHRGAAPPQRIAARRGARVPRRRVHRGPARSRRRRCSTSSRRSAASATRATS